LGGNIERFQVFPLLVFVSGLSPLTASPHKPARLSWCPLKTTPTEEGWRLGFFVKGDRPKTNSRAHKKKTMKTNTVNTKSGLKNRSEQWGTSQTAGNRTRETLLPVDGVRRRYNRRLNTDGVLNLMVGTVPEVYRLAEVVGKWVWIQFAEAPAAEIRQKLSQIGFHWNRHRQSWQHPCGHFCHEATPFDPRRFYGSYFAAGARLA
jgi:hypothetical protein